MVKNSRQHHPSKREQTTESLKRKQTSGKQRQKRILIVCEGETERIYFMELRRKFQLHAVVVDTKNVGSAPINVVERALKKRNEVKNQPEDKFDEIWCVFDRESETENSTFHEAVKKAQDNSLQLAVSNPSFEFWYLLHFRETTRLFANSHEVERELRNKTYIPDYEKNMDVYARLADKTEDAIKRSQHIRQNHPDYPTDKFPNPSTTVCKLVKKLRDM
jgi:hypothetical protein